ncbi:MAG: hypothetical protein WC551_10905 [Patescibacteria group bacterium]
MGAEAAIGIGGALLGSWMGADASKDASKAQSQSARYSADIQKYIFDMQRQMQEPFRQGGLTAQNRLMYLLGLGGKPGQQKMTREQLRAQLLPQFTKTSAANQNQLGQTFGKPGAPAKGGLVSSVANRFLDKGMIKDLSGQTVTRDQVNSIQNTGGIVDEAALNAEIDRMLAEQEASSGYNEADFGKYGRDFGMQDFQADPGYAFRLSEGLKGLDRQAAARGGLISGAALKAATRYGQDMGSQEYTNAFNRYQVNRANQLNPLQSLMGGGQTAAQTIGSAGQNYANQAGEAYQNVGNARASGYMGRANAIAGGVNQLANYYQMGGFGGGNSGGGSGYGSSFNADDFSNQYLNF